MKVQPALMKSVHEDNLNNGKMKTGNFNSKLILLIAGLIASLGVLAQQTYYFDPTNTNDSLEDGSISHPYDSFSDIDWTNHNVFLLKRNTTMNVSDMITLDADYITFGAYGTGENPIIHSTTTNYAFKAWQKWGLRFNDLEIYAPNAVCGIYILGELTDDIRIENCKIHGPEWGIRATHGWTGMKILNCEIYNTKNDGIYAEIDSLEIAYCNIHDVNQDWFINQDQSYSSGDCIQFNLHCDNFWVHHNYLDHSSTGNKFCFIADGQTNSSGIFEHNICVADSSTVFGALYLHAGLNNVIVRYNHIKSAQTGIYSLAMSPQFYYNIIEGCETGIMCSNFSSFSNQIYNNVFYNNHTGYASNFANSELKNNIFYLPGTNDVAMNYPYSNIITTDYNVIYPEQIDFIYYAYGTCNTLEDYRTLSGNGLHSLIADPLFADPANGNFRVQNNSLCIGAGTNVGLPLDYYGTPIDSTLINIDAGISQTLSTSPVIPWDYAPSTQSHTVTIPDGCQFSIDGNPIDTGDYIGVFYKLSGEYYCSGYAQWTGDSVSLQVFGADGINPGFQPGEEMNWRIWSTNLNREYLAIPFYNSSFPNAGLFANNGQSEVLAFNAKELTNQNLNFPQGWSIFSTYVEPLDSSITNIFSDIIADIQVIKDENGNIYWPEYGLDQIGSIAIGDGYQIWTSDTAQIDIPGTKVNLQTVVIDLPAEYNIIGYPKSEPEQIEQVLSSIINNVDLVKDENGLLLWVDYSINEIGQMMPGKGYQIKMKTQTLFTFSD